MFEFSFDKFILGDNNEYYNRYNLFWNNIVRRINNSRRMILLLNFDKFEKTLRRKELTHFSLSYLKILEFFKLDDMKWKVINFDCVSFFRYNFEILFEIRRDWVFVKESNLINNIMMLKRSSSLINFDDDSNVKLFKVIMLANKDNDT